MGEPETSVESTRRGGWLRGLGRVLGVLVLLLASLLASLAYHVQLPQARSLARVEIERLASDALRGDLAIGRIDELGLGRARLTNVVLYDDQQRLVIAIPELVVYPDLSQLFADPLTIRIAGARVTRPFVHLVTVDDIGGPDPNGLEVSLVRAFQPAHPGDPNGTPTHIQLDGLVLDDATVWGDAPRFPGLVVEELDVVGRIDIERDVRIQVFDAHGRMTAPYRGATEIDRIALDFTTDWDEGLNAYAEAHREGSRVRARVRVTRPDPDAPPAVWARAALEPLEFGTLAAMGIPGTPALRGTARGHAVLEGPSDALRLRAYLDTDAVHCGACSGEPVRVEGTLGGDGRYQFDLATDGLALEGLVDGAPAMNVAGHGSVTIEPPEPSASGDGEGTRRVRVELAPTSVAGFALPALRGEGRLEHDALVVDAISTPDLTAGAGGSVRGTGRVGYDGSLDLDVRVDVDDLGRDPNVAQRVPGLHGAARGRLLLTSGARGDDLAYDLDVDLWNFRYGSVRARHLVARGTLRGEPSRPIVRIATHGEGLAVSSVSFGDFRGGVRGGPSGYDLDAATQGGATVRSLDLSARATPRGDAFDLEAPHVVVDAGFGAYHAPEPLRVHVGSAGARFDAFTLARRDPRSEAHAPSRLTVSGAVGPSGARALRVATDDFPLEALRPWMPASLDRLAGQLGATLDVDGPLSAPAIDLRGHAAELSIDAARTGTFDFAIAHSDGLLQVDVDGEVGGRGLIALHGPVRVPFASLTDGTFARRADFDGLRFAIDQVGVPFFLPFFGEEARALDVSGKLSASGELDGTLDDPHVPIFVLILDRFALEGWTPVRIKVELGLDGESLALRRAWLADTDGELALAEGRFGLPLHDLPTDRSALVRAVMSEPWSLGLRLEPRLLDQWPRPLAKYFPHGLRAGGDVTLRGGPAGTTGALQLGLHWEEDAFTAPCARTEEPIVQLRGEIAASGDDGDASSTALELRLSASMFAGDSRVMEASSSLPLPIDAWLAGTLEPRLDAMEVRVALDELPLGRIPWTCGRAGGRATGEASMVLFADDPQLRVAVDVDELRLRYADAQVASQPYHVAVRAESHVVGEGASGWSDVDACAVLTAEDRDRTPLARCPLLRLPLDAAGRVASLAELDPPPVPLEGEAIVQLSAPVRFDRDQVVPELGYEQALAVRGEFASAHLEPLLALVPGLAEVDALGDGSVALRAVGGEAQLSGALEISEGRARVISLGQHLREIEGALAFRGNRIVIDEENQLRASDPAGRVALDGEIGFEGLVPAWAELHLFPDEFPFRREGAILASLAGHARVRSRFDASGLTADIRTSSLAVHLPDRSAGSVLGLETRRDVVVMGEDAPELAIVAGAAYPYRIHLDATEPFVVHRNDFEAELTADLDIVYAQPDLTIEGTAVLRSGTFDIMGKRFQVTRGSLLFLEEAPFDPVIDLVATLPLPGRSGASISIEVGGQLSSMSVAFTSTETNDVGQILSLLVAGSSSRSTEETAQEAGNQAANFMAGLAAGVLTLSLRRELGEVGNVVPAVSIETVGSAGTLRARAFWDASFIIPDFLRSTVVGASVEGFFTSGSSSSTSSGSSTSAGAGGLTLELQFPYGISATGTYIPPLSGTAQSWGADLRWQP